MLKADVDKSEGHLYKYYLNKSFWTSDIKSKFLAMNVLK